MVNEIKKSKMESLIEKINNMHHADANYDIHANELLRLVFNYDELNDYGKIIVKDAKFLLPRSENLRYNIRLDKSIEKNEKRKLLIKEWVDFCCERRDYNCNEEFYFILLAMLVVTVDKTNKEENLSIICDFARMFMITDDEMRDIIEIIKILYDKSDSEVLSQQYTIPIWGTEEYENIRMKKCEELDKHIRSNRVLKSFSKLLKLYVGLEGQKVVDFRQYGYLN